MADFGTRAYVQRNLRTFQGVDLWLVDTIAVDGVPIHRLVQHTDLVMATVDDTAVYTEPSLTMPEPMARALLDGLAAHFGGTGELLTLRRDYEAERKRVDQMIDALIGRQRSDG